MEDINVDIIKTPLGAMCAVVEGFSVINLFFSDDRLLKEIAKKYGDENLDIEDMYKISTEYQTPTVAQLREQIKNYFEGSQTIFTIPLAFQGTDLQLEVWKSLLQIPYGTKVSYKSIAEKLGIPNSVRAVARCIAANPINILIPCHRVIASNGDISGYNGGVWRKEKLLELENIICN